MMTEEQLIERDLKRDIWDEVLESVRQMKAGQVGAVHQVKVSKVIGSSESRLLSTAICRTDGRIYSHPARVGTGQT